MRTFSQSIDSWSEATVQQVVTDGHQETLTVEFKRELPFAKPSDKAELAKDVSAMANGSGGTIIYGIEEKEGPGGIKIAAAAKPLTPGVNAPRDAGQWIDDVLDGNVTPRLWGCRIQEIKAEGGIYVAIRVAPQSNDLHMVQGRFFRRSEKGARPMSEPEVRQAYAAITRRNADAEQWVNKIVAAEADGLPSPGFIWALVPHTFREIVATEKIGRRDESIAHILPDLDLDLHPFGDGVQLEKEPYRFRIRRDGTISWRYPAVGRSTTKWRQDWVLGALVDILATARLKWREAQIVEPATLAFVMKVTDPVTSFTVESWRDPGVVVSTDQAFRISVRQDDLHDDPLAIAREAMDRLFQGLGRRRSPNFQDDGSLEPEIVSSLARQLAALRI